MPFHVDAKTLTQDEWDHITMVADGSLDGFCQEWPLFQLGMSKLGFPIGSRRVGEFRGFCAHLLQFRSYLDHAERRLAYLNEEAERA